MTPSVEERRARLTYLAPGVFGTVGKRMIHLSVPQLLADAPASYRVSSPHRLATEAIEQLREEGIDLVIVAHFQSGWATK